MGANKNSYGWRADGKLFKGAIEGTKFPTGAGVRLDVAGFKEGDIVGCGLILQLKQIFYTLNGIDLGVAVQNVDLGIDLKPFERQFVDTGCGGSIRAQNKRKRGMSQMAEICSESCGLYPGVCL